MNNGLKPKTIYGGNKIMILKVNKIYRFIDIINFISQPLEESPKIFGLTEAKRILSKLL